MHEITISHYEFVLFQTLSSIGVITIALIIIFPFTKYFPKPPPFETPGAPVLKALELYLKNKKEMDKNHPSDNS